MGSHAITRPNDQEISRDLLPPRLPALGYIKIGMQRPGTEGGRGKSPMKIDHFRVTTRERENGTGNFILDEAVHSEVGAKPTSLDLRLPFDTTAENFYAQMVEYSGQTRARQCDGANAIDLNTGVGAVCSRKAGKGCSCKPYGRIGVILEAAPTFGGLYVFRTTSWESVNSIQTALKMFEGQFGSLRGLPLRMRLYPAEVRYKHKGQEKTATAYKVAVELRATYDEARDAALEYHRRHQVARREILQLASGTSDGLRELDRHDADDINGEFFPDTHGGAPRGLSRVGEINQRLLGESDTAPTDPEGPAEVNDQEPQGDAEAEHVQDLRKSLAEAKERSLVNDDQVARLEKAIDEGDETNIRLGTDWLRSHLDYHAQKED